MVEGPKLNRDKIRRLGKLADKAAREARKEAAVEERQDDGLVDAPAVAEEVRPTPQSEREPTEKAPAKAIDAGSKVSASKLEEEPRTAKSASEPLDAAAEVDTGGQVANEDPPARSSWRSKLRKRLQDAVDNYNKSKASSDKGLAKKASEPAEEEKKLEPIPPVPDGKTAADRNREFFEKLNTQKATGKKLDKPLRQTRAGEPLSRQRPARQEREARQRPERSSFENPEVRVLLDNLKPFFEKFYDYLDRTNISVGNKMKVEEDIRKAEGIVHAAEWEMPDRSKEILTSLLDILTRYKFPSK